MDSSSEHGTTAVRNPTTVTQYNVHQLVLYYTECPHCYDYRYELVPGVRVQFAGTWPRYYPQSAQRRDVAYVIRTTVERGPATCGGDGCSVQTTVVRRGWTPKNKPLTLFRQPRQQVPRFYCPQQHTEQLHDAVRAVRHLLFGYWCARASLCVPSNTTVLPVRHCNRYVFSPVFVLPLFPCKVS